MHRTVLKCTGPSLLLAALVLVPFLGKAFTLDDTLFLYQARHVLVDPMHPTAFTAVWNDVPERASQILPSGPVMAWLLVPSALAGGSEEIAHLTQLAAFAVALAATVTLALRLGLSPLWASAAGLLLVATPTALGMSGTAMPDVPAMALGVAGLERLVAWRDRRGFLRAASAAALLALAALARSHLILLLGVGALLLAGDYLVTRDWRHRPWSTWVPVAVAPLLVIAIAIVTRDPEGSSTELARTAAALSTTRHLSKNLVSFATHWALAAPLAISWTVMRLGPLARRWYVFLLGGGVAVALIGSWSQPRTYGAAAIAALTATVLFDVIADAWMRRDSLQLTFALWLLVPLPLIVYLHLPPKYLLASAPAAALLIAREMGTRALGTRRALVAVTGAVGIALGVAILRADAAFADLGRRAAAELIARPVAAGHRVWFVGHWGFQWYAERAGGRIVSLEQPFPSPGDLLVVSLRCMPSPGLNSVLANREFSHIARIEDRRPGGRIMSQAAGAGFFSNGWGDLPWAWGDDVLDQFDLWRIE